MSQVVRSLSVLGSFHEDEVIYCWALIYFGLHNKRTAATQEVFQVSLISDFFLIHLTILSDLHTLHEVECEVL